MKRKIHVMDNPIDHEKENQYNHVKETEEKNRTQPGEREKSENQTYMFMTERKTSITYT
jgi:hypothetical protein